MSGGSAPLYATDDKTVVGSEMSGLQPGASAEAMAPLSVGARLRAGREAKGLSAADIAKTLKLSPHQVEALEADDWSRLPCNTIIRGFVRNYARLLNLNPDVLMAMLDQLHMPHVPELEMPVGTNVRVPHEGAAERRDYFRVFSGLSVLGLAVLAYFFFPQDLWQSTLSALKATAQPHETAVESVAPPVAEMKAPAPEIVPPATTVFASEQPVVAVPSLPVSDLPSIPQSSSGNGLKFSFSQPSWVEVRDRSGEIIFSQLSQAGSQREIEGQPPFALVIGNASYVTLLYKGKPVDLSKRSRDDVARVTVE